MNKKVIIPKWGDSTTDVLEYIRKFAEALNRGAFYTPDYFEYQLKQEWSLLVDEEPDPKQKPHKCFRKCKSQQDGICLRDGRCGK